MINAEVTKTGTENALSTIRKFSRRVQGANIVKTTRAGRYHSRLSSKTVNKKRALKYIKRRDEFQQLLKEGKVTETPKYRTPSHARTQSSSEATASTNTSSKLGEGTPIAR